MSELVLLQQKKGWPGQCRTTGAWLLFYYVLCAFIFSASIVKAEYEVSNKNLTKLHHLRNPIYFTRKNELYIIGGNGQYEYEEEGISLKIDGEIAINNSTAKVFTPPVSLRSVPGASVVYSDQDDVLYFIYGQPMAIMRYIFQYDVWENMTVSFPTAENPGYDFRMRYGATATLGADGAIYLYGGYVINYGENRIEYRSMLTDIHMYDPSSGSLVVIKPGGDLPLPMLEYHTGTLLKDGSILYLGGRNRVNYTVGNITGAYQYDNIYSYSALDTAYRFFPKAQTIEAVPLQPDDQKLNARVPSLTTQASALLSADGNTVYFFGGYGMELNAIDGYLMPSNDLWMLDTSSWHWTLAEPKGDPPLARVAPASALLMSESNPDDGAYLVYVHGETENAYLADINVMSITRSAWLRNITLGPASDTKKNPIVDFFSLPAPAILILIASVIIGIILVGFLVFHLREWADEIFLWDLRRPNPVVIEILHIVCKLGLTGILIGYTYHVLYEVFHSAKIDQTTLPDGDGTVNIPDIRFCFDGWELPEVRCKTDTLDMDNCTSLGFIHHLDMSVHQPYFASGTGAVECLLFAPPPWFQLQKNIPGRNMNPEMAGNGSYIKFEFYNTGILHDSGGEMLSGLVQISAYPLDKDPNIYVYNINEEQVIGASNKYSALHESDLSYWLANEKYDFQRDNTFYTQPGVSSMGYYTLQHYQDLDDHVWNYVGTWSKYSRSNRTVVEFRDGIPTQHFLGLSVATTFTLSPNEFGIVEVEEKVVHTLMAAIGSIFGVAAFLMTQLDVFLFGRSRNNPWGLMQRLFVRSKVKQKLARSFMKPSDQVPFVEPVKAPRDDAEKDNFVRARLRRIPTIREPGEVNMRNLNDDGILSSTLTAADIAPPAFSLYGGDGGGNMALSRMSQQQQIDALVNTVQKMQMRMQYTELVLKTHYIDPVVFDAIYDGSRAHGAEDKYDESFFQRLKTTWTILRRAIARRRKSKTYNPVEKHDTYPKSVNDSIAPLPGKVDRNIISPGQEDLPTYMQVPMPYRPEISTEVSEETIQMRSEYP